MNVHEITRELRKLGLTSYEASCYVWLARLGPTEPRRVAAKAGIPYPNVYEALKRLAMKGWAELVRRRPAVYRAIRPKTIYSDIQSRLQSTFSALEKFYRRIPVEETELVYTLRGRERVLSKLLELLDGAESNVFFVAPTVSLAEERVLAMIQRVLAKGVNVRAITDEEGIHLFPGNAEVRVGKVLVAVDLLVDGNRALISLPDYSACGWVDSPQVAAHFLQFLELLWNASIGTRR